GPLVERTTYDGRFCWTFTEGTQYVLELSVFDGVQWTCPAVEGRLAFRAGFNDQVQIEVEWSLGGYRSRQPESRLLVEYCPPGVARGESACLRGEGATRNWGGIGDGYGNPQMTSYDGTGIRPTRIRHLSTPDQPVADD